MQPRGFFRPKQKSAAKEVTTKQTRCESPLRLTAQRTPNRPPCRRGRSCGSDRQAALTWAPCAVAPKARHRSRHERKPHLTAPQLSQEAVTRAARRPLPAFPPHACAAAAAIDRHASGPAAKITRERQAGVASGRKCLTISPGRHCLSPRRELTLDGPRPNIVTPLAEALGAPLQIATPVPPLPPQPQRPAFAAPCAAQ